MTFRRARLVAALTMTVAAAAASFVSGVLGRRSRRCRAAASSGMLAWFPTNVARNSRVNLLDFETEALVFQRFPGP